ncbi:MBOAT-domain-containing protein [Daedalea quercina L-15889]|uniref:O-acyltransferase n=1 Tax=Daedalea quercina L-15889 TaxID=1314783 RepID=A0A165RIJ1_9APHY|nr:MBOAT-domain-containing protein [Daedalea quercina L-15889]
MASRSETYLAPPNTAALNGRAAAPGVGGALQRNQSMDFQTPEGTVHVSKPFRSRQTKKLRAMITFIPRKSHFDTTNERSGTNEFRGFFTLFWICMFVFVVRSYISSYQEHGYPLEGAFFSMFSRDAITLAFSDAVLVLSTGLCVPFVKACVNGWIRYYWVGVILQHLWQTSVLFIAIQWTFNRGWPWVQSGFLTLHSLVLVMKMHSYVTTNGQLQWVHKRTEKVYTKLRRLVAEEGGWDAAIETAQQNKAKQEAAQDEIERRADGNTNGTPIAPEGSSYVDEKVALALRKRLASSGHSDILGSASLPSALSASASAEFPPDRPTQVNTTGTRLVPPSADSEPAYPPTPSQILAHHPDSQIADLAREHAELQEELTSPGPERIRWPANVTSKNFVTYMLIPTLVYELEYPRTDKIRPLYVFEKTVATFGTFALLYTVTESFIIPYLPTPGTPVWQSILDLALPFMVALLLLFYLIFECICNGFAELSYFADRRFYDDWWNSTSWDEFSRKWNRPVHTFLLRHVYAPAMTSLGLGKLGAMMFTFLLSAAAHELVMLIVSQKLRMYLFFLQLSQIPMIAVGRLPAIKRNKLLGNIVFWSGLFVGLPLLCVAYIAY